MPNVKKEPAKKLTYRRAILLNPDTAKRVEQLAKSELRPVTSMLRILVEKGLDAATK